MSKTLQNWLLSPWVTVLMLMAVLGLAAYLRLAHIGDNPGWYTDEATHLLIGQQLLKGRSQYLAINQSTLLFARLPLFEWLLAGMGSLFGLNMFTLRVFTAILTLLTLILLTIIVWRTSRRRYVFAPRYQNASFIIIDNLWRNWGLPNVPTLTAITQEIETTWPLVYQSGDIVVYANPRRTVKGIGGRPFAYYSMMP